MIASCGPKMSDETAGRFVAPRRGCAGAAPPLSEARLSEASVNRHRRTMMSSPPPPVHVIGGGLAGCEAAWGLANAGVPVILHDMRTVRGTEAHKTGVLDAQSCTYAVRSKVAASHPIRG